MFGITSGANQPSQLAAVTAPANPPTGSSAATTSTAADQVPLHNRCPKQALACVDKELRLSWLQQGGKIIYGPVPIMPGTPGAADSVATPNGVWHVTSKDQHHVSSEFGEPMENSVFFAPGGIAFHEGSLTTSSHGCVHLSAKDSAYYFAHLSLGNEVAVF
ncbi:MAG: L,D-transpeptidase [Sciscionella sp.]|nr:L,D-transpeptidase [Sciscionella sp.]